MAESSCTVLRSHRGHRRTLVRHDPQDIPQGLPTVPAAVTSSFPLQIFCQHGKRIDGGTEKVVLTSECSLWGAGIGSRSHEDYQEGLSRSH